MNSKLLDQDLTTDVYQDYINKVVDIFHLSSKKSSILFDMKIENYSARIKLSILNQNGKRDKFKDVVATCDYAFYHDFLIPLVKSIYEHGDIATTDTVDLSDNDLVTFRMITTNNDLFSIDGLSKDDAKSLLAVCQNDEKEKESLSLNRYGKGSFFIFILLMVVLIFIIGIFVFYS